MSLSSRSISIESENQGPLFAGDSCALQQQAARLSAYRERDSRGRLPLHVAAPRPHPDVLLAVLRGENGPREGRGLWVCSSFNLVSPRQGRRLHT